MDEPTVGIDRNSEESFYELMKSLNRERGITLVMVTHDIGAIDKRVNRVLCLSEGKLYEHDCAVSQASDIFKEAYGKRDSWTITHRH